MSYTLNFQLQHSVSMRIEIIRINRNRAFYLKIEMVRLC